MNKTITISYWWKCDEIKGEIPEPLATALQESAEDRIKEMMGQGFNSGELLDNVNIDIPDLETPEDGWECKGWWEAKEVLPED